MDDGYKQDIDDKQGSPDLNVKLSYPDYDLEGTTLSSTLSDENGVPTTNENRNTSYKDVTEYVVFAETFLSKIFTH